MISEYFNQPDEACQRKLAETISSLLKAQADFIGERGISCSTPQELETVTGVSKNVVREVIEKCYSEISDSPEAVNALLATELISAIMALPSTRSLHERILRSFLVDKIVDPLIEGEDHYMHGD